MEADVFRGLDPKYFHDGRPTDVCFVMRKKHDLKDGPSHLRCDLIPRQEAERFFDSKWVLVRLTVGEMLRPPGQQPLSERGVRIVPLPDSHFEEYANAHAVLTGYQDLSNKEIGDFKRYLAQLAGKALDAQVATGEIANAP